MESSNMYSRSSIQWLCVILVLAFIHGISCEPNSGCLRNGNTELHIDQCIGENGLEIVPRNIDGLLGKFNFMKEKDNKDCFDLQERIVSIHFGQGCMIDLEVGLAGQNVYVNRPNDGVNINAHKLLLDKGGLKYEDEGRFKIGVSCTPELEAESKSLKLMFTEGKETVPIKGCGYYLKFDDALVRHTTTTSTTTTATTTTLSTPSLSTLHPAAPTDKSPEPYIDKILPWLVISGIIIILLVIIGVGAWYFFKWKKSKNPDKKSLEDGGEPSKPDAENKKEETKEKEEKEEDCCKKAENSSKTSEASSTQE